MKFILKEEFYRCIKSKTFRLCLYFCTIMCVANSIISYSMFIDNGKYSYPWSFLAGWAPMNIQLPFAQIINIFLPLIAAIPFGGSAFYDLDSGYIRNILVKTSAKRYYCSKYIVCFTSGFIICFYTFILSFLLEITHMPIVNPCPFVEIVGIREVSFLSNVYFTKPLLYMIIYTLINSYAAGLFAVTSMCTAPYVKNIFEAIVTPFVFLVVIKCILERLDLCFLDILNMINPQQNWKIYGSVTLVTFVIWTIVSFYFGCIKRRDKEVINI